MSEIEWSPWTRNVDYKCPVDGKMVVSVKSASGVVVDNKPAIVWAWNNLGGIAAEITHYRIPMADYQRIYGGTADDQKEPYQSVTVPVDPLESHPDSELDADPYSVGADAIDTTSGSTASMADQYPAYYKDVSGVREVDVYAVHQLFGIEDPSGCIHHASKKLLLSGLRTGGKSKRDDIREARDTLTRWLDLNHE